jgi:hypothetical protein
MNRQRLAQRGSAEYDVKRMRDASDMSRAGRGAIWSIETDF